MMLKKLRIFALVSIQSKQIFLYILILLPTYELSYLNVTK